MFPWYRAITHSGAIGLEEYIAPPAFANVSYRMNAVYLGAASKGNVWRRGVESDWHDRRGHAPFSQPWQAAPGELGFFRTLLAAAPPISTGRSLRCRIGW